MTQPPDDLERRPDGSLPDDPTAPEDQPTIAWTPPEPTGDATPSGTPPDTTPAEPQPSSAEPQTESPATADTPLVTPWEAPVTTPPAPPPASPIISASPSTPPDATGWQQPAPAGPVVAWETPGPAGAAPGREGYVIAGIGARLVAYLLDGLIVAIIPTILTLFVIDYGGMIQQAIESGAATGGRPTDFVMDVTPEFILVSLIGLAIQYIYLVGFWTSRGKATPGMRGLRMQVVDAATGGELSLTAATKRFIALGAPLSLLVLVPALQSAAGVAQFALSLFLFFTTITNDRRQGLHDKWANSLVIRSASSGDGATLVGCLLLIVIVVGFGIILTAVALAALGPQLDDLMRQMENAA